MLFRMAGLYPSLEDMKVDQMIRAQNVPPYPGSEAPPTYSSNPMNSNQLALYPSLDDYMGLSLQTVGTSSGTSGMLAPLTGTSLGLHRSQVNHGVREVIICKDQRGKVGLRMEAINKGVFIVLVEKDTPASMVNLRFGDQVLSINDEYVAGYTLNKVHDLIRKLPGDRITIAVRDRPFERTVTMVKDSHNYCGFDFKEGQVNTLVKDSSAARNGLLIDHNLLEVNGQNVVGLKDSVIREIIRSSPQTVTVTIMPSVIYDHLVKHTSGGLIKKLMDRSLPEF